MKNNETTDTHFNWWQFNWNMGFIFGNIAHVSSKSLFPKHEEKNRKKYSKLTDWSYAFALVYILWPNSVHSLTFGKYMRKTDVPCLCFVKASYPRQIFKNRENFSMRSLWPPWWHWLLNTEFRSQNTDGLKLLEKETKNNNNKKTDLSVSSLQINFDSSIVLLDFSLEDDDIKPAAIQFWKRQHSQNSQ